MISSVVGLGCARSARSLAEDMGTRIVSVAPSAVNVRGRRPAEDDMFSSTWNTVG